MKEKKISPSNRLVIYPDRIAIYSESLYFRVVFRREGPGYVRNVVLEKRTSDSTGQVVWENIQTWFLSKKNMSVHQNEIALDVLFEFFLSTLDENDKLTIDNIEGGEKTTEVSEKILNAPTRAGWHWVLFENESEPRMCYVDGFAPFFEVRFFSVRGLPDTNPKGITENTLWQYVEGK